MTSWAGHSKVWKKQTICRGVEGNNSHAWEKQIKKCTFGDAKRNFLLLFLSCFTTALILSMQVSPFPTLLNMRIKKLRAPLTTCCSLSLNSQCCPFQRVQYHDTCFQESLAFLIFHEFTLHSPVSTSLCRLIQNPRMDSWLLRKQVAGYQKQKTGLLPKKGSLHYVVMTCFLNHAF